MSGLFPVKSLFSPPLFLGVFSLHVMPRLMPHSHASLFSNVSFLGSSAILVLSLGSMKIIRHTSTQKILTSSPLTCFSLTLWRLGTLNLPVFSQILSISHLPPFSAASLCSPTFNYLNTLPARPHPKKRVLILLCFFYT